MAVDLGSPQVLHEPLLRVRDLAVSFGPLHALDGVDLDVAPGEIVALAGENGAGKSTLVRCIAGDMAPTSGEVSLAGERIPADPAAANRRGIAIVWQDLALCDNLDVASNLLLGRETARLMRSETRFHATAARLLHDLQIPLGDTTRNVRTLSGGQRQLLAVARAVRDQPKLLILDEPTAALGVTWSAQVEELTRRLRDRGTTIMLVSHDIEQMFRLADRIAVLRHGRIVSNIDPSKAHPDDLVALMSGQQVDVSARRQLDRLQMLVDRLASADPSSSLTVILSALGAALGADRICVHLLDDGALQLAGSIGLGPAFQQAWAQLPLGLEGGPVGLAAADETARVDMDAPSSRAWRLFADLARHAEVGSSWAVPVAGSRGLIGVITVLRRATGHPGRGELDLVTLYAGYVVSAVERDHLLDELTARNRVLETIREVLEALAGPIPLSDSLASALDALRRGLRAGQVALAEQPPGGNARWRALVGRPAVDKLPPTPRPGLLDAAICDGTARSQRGPAGARELAVSFLAPGGPGALLAWWPGPVDPAGPTPGADPFDRSLLEDAARSLQLALEREESERAHQETRALRRSQELQRGFLFRLSHELRTPLTAIRGYASSLLQPDVTWDGDSEQRFLSRIATESARVERLVDDLLDFSVIESDILRLQPDWCDLQLVLDAAAACLPPASATAVSVDCEIDLPVVWADHDRLEQVFVNLLDNAVRHNPPGTKVRVVAGVRDSADVLVSVTDDGIGMPPDLTSAPFGSPRTSRSRTAGAGLGLSIAKGIIDAHGGDLRVHQAGTGTRFEIRLPIESPGDDGRLDAADDA
jgi:signal transduction histidine kinase/ABC-type multidrug transport system ATPase subunit